MTRSLVIGTAGHIDHGKSALVKALTGIDPDRLKEEQARGITIDLGFAHATIDDVNVAFVDVPGHERFVRNMLAGAGGIDAVALVIAADESVMPQTREHFEICRLLGLERGVIVITKADRVDADAVELATLDARELVAGSFLDGAPVVAVSARTGAGLDALRRVLAGLAGGAPRQERAGIARLPVDRVFTVRGFGTVVTGTLVSGEIRSGQDLSVVPDSREVRVRGVQVHGRDVASARAPHRVAVNLGAVDVAELARGMTLASPGALSVTRRVDGRLELLAGARPLKHGARVRVHSGTAERLARVAICAARATREAPWTIASVGEASVAIPPGGEAYVRLRLERPLALTRGDRLVTRAYSPPATIGGGVVLDPEPPRAGLRRSTTLDRFIALDGADAFAHVWLREAGVRGLDAGELIARGGLGPEASRSALEALVAADRAVRVGARVFDRATWREIESRVVSALTAFHAAQPLAVGMPRESLREQAAPEAPASLVDDVLGALARSGRIAGADRISLTAHRPPVSPEDTRAADQIDAALRQAGLTAPDAAALAQATKLAPPRVERALQTLARAGTAMRVDALWFHADALERLRADVKALALARGGAAPVTIDVATFKQRFGLSRKHAIPLLEWLDRERVTRRVGDRRIVL